MDFSRLTDPQAYKDALAGLLRRGSEVGDYIQEAPTKVGQSIMDAGQRQSALMNKAFDPTGNTLIRDPSAANQAAMNLFEGPMSFAPAGITAFHGTPHLIKDKFDISKVGTGEGAQAYGHGMYFAENPEVATQYQKALSTPFKEKGSANQLLDMANGNYDEALKLAQRNKNIAEIHSGKAEHIESAKKTLDILNKMKNGEKLEFGNLYKVDIPDEYIPKMLDYDKPLKDQVNILDSLLSKNSGFTGQTKREIQELVKNGANGEDLVRLFGKDQVELSNELSKLGIKGIRYLDEGSRGMPFKVQVFDNNNKLYTENLFPTKDQANMYMEQYKLQGYAPKFSEVDKKRTSNFVVFDPTDVKILERNNQPISRKELLQEQIDKIAK